MSLTAGQRLGPYEVLSPLGAGGMGEVYRARDTKLNRDVAIKVLLPAVANDADRLARFTREARTLASLNHPNIAHIHGFEESGRVRAIVMELVEGEDLSQRIARGAIPLDGALSIAKQIADALEAAHELGIVHRDLKPANIKVRTDGTVKVLDFGLAKQGSGIGDQGSGDLANSPTLSIHATEAGLILGTAAYMSPEQARGRAVDKRTDVWAFGCVLYEMLSGRKAFNGEDATEIISAVMTAEPDWHALPASVPAHVRTIVTRCLVKDRKTRIPDLSVVRFLLDGSLAVAASVSTPIAPTPLWRRLLPWAVAGVLGVVALLLWAPWRTPASPAVVRLNITAPDKAFFGTASVPVISPDGRTLAFTAVASGKGLLWLRPIDSLTATALEGTDGAQFPFWSPDGRTIGFSMSGKLVKIPATGGPVVTVCALAPSVGARGAAWNRGGVIVFNNGPAPLYRVSLTEGTCAPMGTLSDGEVGRQWPRFLPDGRHLLYHSTAPQERGGIFVTSLDAPGESQRILPADTGAIYDPSSGLLLFVRQGTLLAQTFDPKTFRLSGDAFPVAEHLNMSSTSSAPPIVGFSVSETGTLVYAVSVPPTSVASELVWVDRQGQRISTVGPPGNYRGIDLSPDGSKVAVHLHNSDGGDVSLIDVRQGTTAKFTFDASQDNASPAWSPEGSRIAFSSIRSGKAGVYVKNANRTGEEVRLYEATAVDGFVGPQPQSWMADGRSLLFEIFIGKTAWEDLWSLSTSGDGRAVPLVNGPDREIRGQFSPDGSWLAYEARAAGQNEIFVRPSSATGGQWPVSTGGGSTPRWRGDSRELFYLAEGKMMAVGVKSTGTVFEPGTPAALFDHGIAGGTHADYFPYAVTKDGQRFLISRPVAADAGKPAPASPPMVVVLNWIEGIRK